MPHGRRRSSRVWLDSCWCRASSSASRTCRGESGGHNWLRRHTRSHSSPSARRVAEIQDRIGTLGVRCVFSEPQFQPALIATVIGDSGARQGVLDPLGAELSAGPDAYFLLLSTLSDALRNCLGGS